MEIQKVFGAVAALLVAAATATSALAAGPQPFSLGDGQPSPDCQYYEVVSYDEDGGIGNHDYYLHQPRMEGVSTITASLTMDGATSTSSGSESSTVPVYFSLTLRDSSDGGSTWDELTYWDGNFDAGETGLLAGTYKHARKQRKIRATSEVTTFSSTGKPLKTYRVHSPTKTY